MGRRRIEHKTENGIELKRCGTCKQWLPLEIFYQNQQTWDGLSSRCRPCNDEQTKIYYEGLRQLRRKIGAKGQPKNN